MDSRIPVERDEARADEVPRKFVLPGKRLPGLIILVLLPLAAVLGLTSRQATVSLEQDGLSLLVEYPRVQRYLNPRLLHISVTNVGDQPLPDTHVSLTRSYMDAYTGVSLVPGEEYINDSDVVVALGDLAPGETRRIRAELRSHTYWSHRGELTVSSGGTRVVADLRSLVLP